MRAASWPAVLAAGALALLCGGCGLVAGTVGQAAPALVVQELDGETFDLAAMRGRVVAVNFWATWCPPCRKEMPDMQALYQRFAPKGLVILAISDEDVSKVEQFIADHHFSYPILLDPGRKVNELFRVEGIPKSFVYDRDGKLVAEAIDMRTERQLLEMLAHAGLE
jgi:peroxiredoxin